MPYRQTPRRSSLGGGRQRVKWVFGIVLAVCILISLIASKLANHGSPTPMEAIAAEDAHAAATGGAFNFTAAMGPFWASYRAMLLGEHEGLFAEVDAAGRAIDALRDALPPGEKKEEEDDDDDVHGVIEKGVQGRELALAMARAEFDRFLAARERAVRDIIGNSTLWHRGADSQLVGVGSRGAGFMFHIAEQFWTTAGKSNDTAFRVEKNALEKSDNKTLAALAESSKWLMEQLMETHFALWRQADYQGLQYAGRIYAAAALASEKKFLPLLKEESSRTAEVWKPAYDSATEKLKTRLEGLGEEHEEMQKSLRALWGRFQWETLRNAPPEDVCSPEADMQEIRVWARAARDMLQTWATLLMDAQEGVLFSLRKKELETKNRTTLDFDASWDEWKKRNCGGTSCYAASGLVSGLKQLVIGGKPRANVAQDEKQWSKTFGDKTKTEVKVWLGVYEKACCEDGKLAELLKNGSRDGLDEVEG
ncbi:hypothetical protein F4779DRAFT_619491 [Xylariaceae sp. FL0662B]|nr:hypothetical protein F4779DRAFT_619491 [Xylariaceae sp. FL0662B]